MKDVDKTTVKWFYIVLSILYLIDAVVIVMIFHFPIVTIQVPLMMLLATSWICTYGNDKNRMIRIAIPLLLFYITVLSQVCMVVY